MHLQVNFVRLLLTGVVITGKTPSGPKHQNGRGQKENQRGVNQPALHLLCSLRLPKVYGSWQGNQRRRKSTSGSLGIEKVSSQRVTFKPDTKTLLELKAKDKTEDSLQALLSRICHTLIRPVMHYRAPNHFFFLVDSYLVEKEHTQGLSFF